MSIQIADHVRDIPRSGIRDFFEIVQSMRRCHLAWESASRTLPPHGIFGRRRSIRWRKDAPDIAPILASPIFGAPIAKYVADHFGVQYEPLSEVLVSVGVSEAIDVALRALLNPGDEVPLPRTLLRFLQPERRSRARRGLVAIPTRPADHFVLRAEAPGTGHHAAHQALDAEFSDQSHGRHDAGR